MKKVTNIKEVREALAEAAEVAWIDPKFVQRAIVVMECRQIRSNEIPVVLGALIVALADHSVEQINSMVIQASISLRDNNPPAAA